MRGTIRDRYLIEVDHRARGHNSCFFTRTATIAHIDVFKYRAAQVVPAPVEASIVALREKLDCSPIAWQRTDTT